MARKSIYPSLADAYINGALRLRTCGTKPVFKQNRQTVNDEQFSLYLDALHLMPAANLARPRPDDITQVHIP